MYRDNNLITQVSLKNNEGIVRLSKGDTSAFKCINLENPVLQSQSNTTSHKDSLFLHIYRYLRMEHTR